MPRMRAHAIRGSAVWTTRKRARAASSTVAASGGGGNLGRGGSSRGRTGPSRPATTGPGRQSGRGAARSAGMDTPARPGRSGMTRGTRHGMGGAGCTGGSRQGIGQRGGTRAPQLLRTWRNCWLGRGGPARCGRGQRQRGWSYWSGWPRGCTPRTCGYRSGHAGLCSTCPRYASHCASTDRRHTAPRKSAGARVMGCYSDWRRGGE